MPIQKSPQPAPGLREKIAAFASESVSMDRIRDKVDMPMTEAERGISVFSLDGKQCISSPMLSHELWGAVMERFQQGVERGKTGYMTMKNRPPIIGRHIESRECLGRGVHVAALDIPNSGIIVLSQNDGNLVAEVADRVDEVPRAHVRRELPGGRDAAIIDLAIALEDAVERTQLFRHGVLDGYPPMMLDPREMAGDSDSIVRERLEWLQNETAAGIDRTISNLKRKIGRWLKRTIGTSVAALNVYRSLKYDSMFSMQEEETDVEQVLRLANSIARSSAVAAVSECAISDNLSPARVASLGYNDPWSASCFVEFLGKMAELAYGSTFLRMGDMERRLVMEGPESREYFFLRVGMRGVLKRLLSPPYDTPGEESAVLIGAEEDEWREAATAAVEEICREAGFSFHSIPGILRAFEEINSTDFLTMENLPAVASVWNQVYRDPIPRIQVVNVQ
jgi:hypothetical protein